MGSPETTWSARGRGAATGSLLALALVTAALARPACGGVLRGRLLLGARPAAGVTVSAIPYEDPLEQARREARRLPAPLPLATATAGADGAFVLTVPQRPEGPATFVVRFDGAAVASTALGGAWDVAESADLGEHVLAAGGSVSGKVVAPDGAAVAGAEVTMMPPPARQGDADLEAAASRTVTATDGSFTVGGASAAGNTLTVDAADFQVARQRGVRTGRLRTPIVLAAGVPIGGTVLAVGGAAPAPGALVRFEGRVTTRWVEAGEDGTFLVRNAPAGPATVVADAGAAGYREQPGVALPPPQEAPLRVVLRPPAALTGRTVDARTGRPVPRVRIALRAPGIVRSVRSAPDGTYALTALPPRSWQVRADEPRFVPWTRATVAVRSGETRRLEIPLVIGATLAGRVVDEDGQPVAGAVGTITRTEAMTPQRMLRRLRETGPPAFKTGSDGTFTATRLAPGSGQVVAVAHPEFERFSLGGIDLVGGAAKAGLVVVLQRGAAVTGVVRDGQRQPVAGARVELSQPFGFGGRPGRGGRGGRPDIPSAALADADRKSALTGADGGFAIHGVAPGEYVLTASGQGFATERVEPVKVPAQGAVAPVEVSLAPGAAISGRVAFRSGAGAEGYRVFVAAPGRQRFGPPPADEPATGPDGAFSIAGLVPGESYDLEVVGSGASRQGRSGVVAPAADVEITVVGAGRITGTAVDAASGAPLTEFQVSYAPDRGAGRGPMALPGGATGVPIDVQNDDGSFALESVPAGTWSVVVTAAGYQQARTGSVVVEEGATRDGVMVRASRGTVVSGTVVDAQTTAGIANASVSLQPAGGQGRGGFGAVDASVGDVATDTDGRFELDGVAPGSRTLRVSQPDYADAVQTVAVADEGTTVTIQMSKGGALAGTVVSDTGQPVRGATVTLGSGAGRGGFGGGLGGAQETQTDGSGRFHFEHVAAGRYSVGATLASRTAAPVDVVLQPGQDLESVALQLETGVTLLGTVTGLPAGELGGLTVTAAGADGYFGSTHAGSDGSFELDGVPPGLATVRGTAVTAAGSTRSAAVQVTIPGDQPTASVELDFPAGYALWGRVTRAGEPVAGAIVAAALVAGGRQATATSDDGGAYRLDGLEEGTYAVMATSAAGGAFASRRVTVTVTEDQSLDLELPSATISGRVEDAETRAPLANASVSLAAASGGGGPGRGQRPTTTDSNGQFSFAGLDEGSYTLSTSRADYQLDQRDVTASDEAGDAVVVPLRRGSGIGLRALDGLTGLPLRAVSVRVLDGSGAAVTGPLQVALDGAGQGEITSLPPGVYILVAAAPGYAPTRLDGVSVPAAAVTVALTPGGSVLVRAGQRTLASGPVSAMMTAATGQPALLSVFNLLGRVAISEPSVQLRNVPPGTYLLSLPGGAVSSPFTVGEGTLATVDLP